jgi:DNA-binding XRE family transcriptional regulator
MKDMTMPLGEKIRQLRSERGWSQGELAAWLGGDPGQISRYETGKISPSVDVVVKLAETFGVSADYLLIDGAARRPRPPTCSATCSASDSPSSTSSPQATGPPSSTSSTTCSPTTAPAPPSPATPADRSLGLAAR